MAITYHAGRRIQATSTDFAGIPAVVGGWKEIGRTTLGSNSVDFDVTGLADKRYYMYLIDAKFNDTNSRDLRMQTGNGSWDDSGDASGNYNENGSSNGGSPSTGRWDFVTPCNGTGNATPSFGVGYCANKSDKEKLFQNWFVSQRALGAGSTGVPDRKEHVWKWANTSNPLDRLKVTRQNNSDTTYLFSTGSQIVVLGWDDSDTHTTNFWEELADISLTSTNTSLDSGTFTAKKYLWVQMYQKGMTGNNTLYNFNSDTGSSYARRWRIDGGTEWTTPSTTGLMCHNAVGTQTDNFFNMFIVNNSANEKLVISSSVYTISTGAGSPPSREEHVGKWDNTSSQITSIQFDHGGSNFGIGSSIKVWGSD